MNTIIWWFYRITAFMSGGCVVVAVTKGTMDNVAYDERTYYLALAILALMLMSQFFELADKRKRVLGK